MGGVTNDPIRRIEAALAFAPGQVFEPIGFTRSDLSALLDRLKAAEGECERLREFERSAALMLPGVYYMDPPDGGDVSLLKQLQRMSNDAARYRLLRRKFAIISDGNGNAEFCPIDLPRPTYIAPNTAIELDTALDRERLGMDGVEAETLRRIKDVNK